MASERLGRRRGPKGRGERAKGERGEGRRGEEGRGETPIWMITYVHIICSCEGAKQNTNNVGPIKKYINTYYLQ